MGNTPSCTATDPAPIRSPPADGGRHVVANEMPSGAQDRPQSADPNIRNNNNAGQASSGLTGKSNEAPGSNPGQEWTKKTSDTLQASVDRIFASSGKSLFGLEFSFTIADPSLPDCPLIGCSTGFTKLCGYGVSDIVGRNCRFLVDPVPKDEVDSDVRRLAKEFCAAVRDGKDYTVPDADRKAWMPKGRPADELICMQRNMRKDGTLFNNLFYMKSVFLSMELGEGQPYVVALQSELVEGQEELSAFANNLGYLDENMRTLKRELSALFFMQCCMSRQLISRRLMPGLGDEVMEPQGDRRDEDAMPMAPTNLDSGFDPQAVQPWEESRFKCVQKLCDASRNQGIVQLMQDQHQNNMMVAVKQMPNTWLCKSHDDFVRTHPNETELPWQDIGCTQFLNNANYKYCCNLEGVFRNSQQSFVNFSFAPGGDLFSVALSGVQPGPEREAAFPTLVIGMCKALKLLHEMGISHRDISLENILLTHEDATAATTEVRLIDFAMASRERTFRNCVRGKPSYQAPEMRERGRDYDAFSSDVFALGVILYSLFLRDYPWLSTKPGTCMHFEYVKKSGFKLYCAKRKVRGCNVRVAQCLSEPLFQLLEGILSLDPDTRLTLGEKQNEPGRKSVWDEPWIVDHLKRQV